MASRFHGSKYRHLIWALTFFFLVHIRLQVWALIGIYGMYWADKFGVLCTRRCTTLETHQVTHSKHLAPQFQTLGQVIVNASFGCFDKLGDLFCGCPFNESPTTYLRAVLGAQLFENSHLHLLIVVAKFAWYFGS